jgi:ABC-type antimicrobial peptide transport system permease subunit
MKTFILSWKLFLKKPFANAVLALELAITMLVVVVASNIYQYSQNSIRVIENSSSRLLYCSDPNYSDANKETFTEKLQSLSKQYPYVKGFSKIYESAVLFEREHFDKGEATPETNGSEIMVYDETTFSNIRLPLSSGTWPEAKLDGGKIPCLVGGVSAGRYKVGDVISGYVPGTGSPLKLVKSRDYIVKGILSVPQMSLNVGDSSTNIDAASNFFTDMTNRNSFLIVPGNLFSGGATGEHSFYGAFVFLDRSCTQAQIDGLRNEMNRGYTQLDTEIVAAEQAQNGETFQTLMPFLIVLFLVVFLGLISVCMLTTMQNMQTFKVYYLTGCPRNKILLMMFWYVLFYFVISGALFAVFLACLQKTVDHARTMDAYFIVQPSGMLAIGIVCAVVLVCSLAVPFVLIRKNDPAALLRKD